MTPQVSNDAHRRRERGPRGSGLAARWVAVALLTAGMAMSGSAGLADNHDRDHEPDHHADHDAHLEPPFDPDLPRARPDQVHIDRVGGDTWIDQDTPLALGASNKVMLLVVNPTEQQFTGVIRFHDMHHDPWAPAPAIPVVGTGEVAVDVDPGQSAEVEVIVTPPVDREHWIELVAEIAGDLAGESLHLLSPLGFPLLPPVSIRWVEPQPVTDLADVVQLDESWSEGLGTVAYVRPDVELLPQIEMTNFGQATETVTLRPARFGEAFGDATVVSELVPGETRQVTLDGFVPAEVEPELASRAGSMLLNVGFVNDEDPDSAWVMTAYEFDHGDSPVRADTPAAVDLQVRTGVAAVVSVSGQPTLGHPLDLTVEVINLGPRSAAGAAEVTVAAPFQAAYEVYEPATHTVPFGLEPQASTSSTVTVDPRVGGRWRVFVTWEDTEGRRGMNVFGFDVPTSVDIIPVSAAPLRLALDGQETTTVRITALADLPSATLRLAIAPGGDQLGGGGQQMGPGGPRVVAALAGLSASVVEAAPDEVEIGDLRAGEQVEVDIAVTAGGSGTYSVVPYVMSEGLAYTGMPPRRSGPQRQSGRRERLPVVEVMVDPNVVGPGLGLAPAALVFVAAVGAHVARRKIVR